MSQPAARLGDATAHGGAVTSGNPTVLINGRPAAAVGDAHVCPMCAPGPHVGGPVLVGAPTVLIGGRPAARVGDACACAAPAPDVIVQGSPNVLIGGASGASSPGAAAASASAFGATAAPGTPGLGATARPLSPWIGVAYQDAAGRPVTGWHYRAEGGADGGRQRDGQLGTGGQVWLDGLAGSGAVEVGLVGVYGCRWERDEARVGEAVGMSARCVGVEDGAFAVFEVWREVTDEAGGTRRQTVWRVLGEVAGGRVEAERPFVYVGRQPDARAPDDSAADPGVEEDVPPPGRVRAPGAGESGARTVPLERPSEYGFTCTVEHVHAGRSGRLRYRDSVEFRLLDASGTRLPRAEYQARLPTGEVRRGTSDADGVVRLEGVPPGGLHVTNVRPRR